MVRAHRVVSDQHVFCDDCGRTHHSEDSKCPRNHNRPQVEWKFGAPENVLTDERERQNIEVHSKHRPRKIADEDRKWKWDGRGWRPRSRVEDAKEGEALPPAESA